MPINCGPVSPDSLEELRKLRNKAFQRGETCLGVLLAGVDLYVSVGWEEELIHQMRLFAEGIREAVENTPTAEDLRRLYDLDGPESPR